MVSLLALLLGASTAQAGGGYDVHLPDVTWHTLETEHFYFYWPESTAPVDDPHYFTTEFSAARLASIAEESYGGITEQFPYPLIEKTHVVIYDQNPGWEGNGFAIAEYDQTGFAADWGPLFRMRGRMEFLSDVFVHEFAHIVSLKAYQPWSEDTTAFSVGGLIEDEEWLRRWGVRPAVGPLPGTKSVNADVGFSVPFIVATPFWWAEGGAEYWSHQAGYNFWGTSRDAFLRMSVLEERVLTRDEWTTRIDKGGFEGERGYNHGYAFGLWLKTRFPDKDVFSETAMKSGERMHWNWDNVMEAVTGVPQEQLYEEWRAHLREHYAAQVAPIQAEGIVAGKELFLEQPRWESQDPKFLAQSTKKQVAEMDEAGAWFEFPIASPEGRYFAAFETEGLVVRKMAPGDWGAISGTYVDEDDSDAWKDWGKRTAYETYAGPWRPDFSGDGRLVMSSWEDRASGWQMANGFTRNPDGYNWTSLAVARVVEGKDGISLKSRTVPNTLRAQEAAWHPDNHTLVFSRYSDGTHDLWTIQADGTGAERHTNFGDGTQISGIDVSPDGTKALVGLYQNYRQDLWLYDLKARTWERLIHSKADEVDPSFTPDGKVLFASDESGIFNVYTLDLTDHTVRRHTNLLGGAYAPWMTADGDLFYTGFTGHGYRNFGIAAADRLDVVVDYPGVCGLNDGSACAADLEEIAFTPELLDARAASRDYSPVESQLRVNAMPMARLSDKNVELGGSIFLGDLVEEHYVQGDVSFGKDNAGSLTYYNSSFWPDIGLGISRYDYKGAYAQGEDLDGLLETTDDVSVTDVKFDQRADDAWFFLSRYWSDTLYGSLGADVSQYSFRGSGSGGSWAPYVVNSGLSASLEWSNYGYNEDYWINPQGGRRVYLDYQLRHTTVVDSEVSGAVYDDGQLFERYHYNRFELGYTEYIANPVAEHHTLQLDMQAGFIDRNVMGWDEFIAGGRHPYDWGPGNIGGNSQFSGYEGWSLSGETMIILAGAYRFPLARNMNLKLGPTYTEKVYLQLNGTIGNLWSHRVEGPRHVEGYSVVPSEGGEVRREVPFKDYSSKNSVPGQENKLLGDVGVELRVRSFIFNDYDWDSFLRVSYGLRPTAGYGDVNQDMVQSSGARDATSELSAEYEPATVRVYLGVGTGW